MLVYATLETNLQAIIDKNDPLFKGFPSSIQSAADQWADAVHSYAGKNLIPPVNPVSLDLAVRSFAGIFATMDKTLYGEQKLEQALAVYASVCAFGMLPPFTGTLPNGILDFSPAFRLGRSGDAAGRSRTLAGIIHAWFRTGTATNSTTGVTVQWS